MRYSICFVSTADRHLTDEEVKTLLKSSKTWNNNHHITGLMLYSSGNFFQVLEGEKEMICDLFKRIKKDQRHYNLIKIFEKEITKTAYDGFESDIIDGDKKPEIYKIQDYINHLDVLEDSYKKAAERILKVFIYPGK